MTDTEYIGLCRFKNIGGNALMPLDDEAIQMLQSSSGKEIVIKEVTPRDIRFHRAYFGLLNFIYDWTTPAFKSNIQRKDFYKFVKVLCGQYEIKYEFKNGFPFYEYYSISFARMNQVKFREYVKEQLPVIYEELIHKLYDADMSNKVIETIEYEFETYLTGL